MKRLLSILLILSMIISFAGCSPSNEVNTDEDADKSTGKAGETLIKDGVYEGTGFGKGGEIKVEVTINDDAVTGIKTLSHNETPGFADAIDTITEDIIAKNSIEVDGVSGCTLTSKGFKEAVTAALTAAGATPDMLKKIEVTNKEVEKENISETHDIVVIGAGGAGLSAAIEAKNAGADVIVLEKMPMVGGIL